VGATAGGAGVTTGGAGAGVMGAGGVGVGAGATGAGGGVGVGVCCALEGRAKKSERTATAASPADRDER
jgi:hypothetical protein